MVLIINHYYICFFARIIKKFAALTNVFYKLFTRHPLGFAKNLFLNVAFHFYCTEAFYRLDRFQVVFNLERVWSKFRRIGYRCT